MSTLLEKALEQVVALPQDEQDAIASQIWHRWLTRTPGRSDLPKRAMSFAAWRGKPSTKTRG